MTIQDIQALTGETIHVDLYHKGRREESRDLRVLGVAGVMNNSVWLTVRDEDRQYNIDLYSYVVENLLWRKPATEYMDYDRRKEYKIV